MVVDYLSSKFGVPVGEIATIGDAQNDVAMFERSGFPSRWATPKTT